MNTRDMRGLRVILFTFLCLVAVSRGALYYSSDPVVLLNATNFNRIVFNVSNAWIVQFYSSWCGHCQAFKPTWITFSHQVIDWDHTIKVAVLDCAEATNHHVCRNYEVQGYPTIRLFPAFANIAVLGKSVIRKGIIGLQESMISFIVDEQNKERGSSNWVNLLRYNGVIHDAHKFAPSEANHSVIILEWPKSQIGSFVVLDLGHYKQIYVRTMAGQPYHLRIYDLTILPALFILDKEGNIDVLKDAGPTRETMKARIIRHLKLKDENVSMTDDYPNNLVTTVQPKLPMVYTDQVYMVDIENTLSYAFRSEVSQHKEIEGEPLEALKLFTDVLVKYLPTRPQVHEYLVNLREYLKAVNNLTGEGFEARLNDLNSTSSVLPNQQSWIRCLGSRPRYRGYPCGLWTLFHTLTVNAFFRVRDLPTYDPLEVMRAIHGYVKNFFGCDYCSQHFQQMYALDAETSVTDAEMAIVWFWQAHNQVNKRLERDISEDPYHPKEQFPSIETCSSCYQPDGMFDASEVKRYLEDIYHENGIMHEGVQDLSSRGPSNITYITPQNNG